MATGTTHRPWITTWGRSSVKRCTGSGWRQDSAPLRCTRQPRTVPDLWPQLLMAALLPCPLELGWHKAVDIPLPQGPGGYSAMALEPQRQQLWLLSDLPAATLSRWSLPNSRGTPPRHLRTLQLQAPVGQQPLSLDSEGLVLDGDQLWVASEGRRSATRQAQLLRFSRASGELLQAVALPEPWRPAAGRGLESNAGPESLARLSAPGERLQLLMAAERPLRQDRQGQVRLLRWWWPAGRNPAIDAPQAAEQGALQAPGDATWGLTDLLVLHQGGGGEPQLLTLWRSYRDPLQWRNQLRLYPLPAAGGVAQPQHSWDLNSLGLTPENWEGMSAGQQGLLLVSDDNRNPLQTSRLALLQPRRAAGCSAE